MGTIREAQPEDLPALHALDRLCFAEGISYSFEELREMLAMRNAVTLVLSTSGEIDGFAMAQKLQSRKGPMGHLITIDVRPDLRCKGAGSSILTALEARMKRDGMRRMRLEVAVDNLPAQAFYRKFGYAENGRIANYYPNATDAILMEKALR